MKTKTIVSTAIAVALILGAGIYFAEQKRAVATPAAAAIRLPIQLANEASHRDAQDPFFQIGTDPDTRRTTNSAPAIHIKGPVATDAAFPPKFDDAAQQKAGNSSAVAYVVTNGSPLLGKHIRITGWIKSSNVEDWAAAYMCIWSKTHGFCRLTPRTTGMTAQFCKVPRTGSKLSL